MSVEKVWKFWNAPEHITNWNFATETWHAPRAENDLKVGGRYVTRMEAKDGSFGFDCGGVYNEIEEFKLIRSTFDDGRKISVAFIADGESTKIVETFQVEDVHSCEQQRFGWQSILDNFKSYAEKSNE